MSVCVFGAAFLLCLALQNMSENDFHVPMVFILVVLIISRLTDGYFYGILAALAGVVAVNYVFTYPYWELDFTMTGYPVTFATMLLVSLVTCTMTTRIKVQERYIHDSEKEKLKADLLRGISHDIRTPLTGIVGASNVLLEGENLDAQNKRMLLEDINTQAQWLIHMVENVLSITRIDNVSGNIHEEPEIVEEVLGEAIAKFRKQWEGIEIRTHVPEDVVVAMMDATLILQVIQNILHNSAIHGQNCTLIEITIRQEKDGVRFLFQDNGCGFPVDPATGKALARSMSESQGKSDRHKNMGIGLSVCAAIIKAHKGELHFSNAPEGGAVVEFLIPMRS